VVHFAAGAISKSAFDRLSAGISDAVAFNPDFLAAGSRCRLQHRDLGKHPRCQGLAPEAMGER
jgi:hypothetical protein